MDIPTLLALWQLGYYKETDLIDLADRELLRSSKCPDEPLILLSTKGPSACVAMSAEEFPPQRVLDFKDTFSIKLSLLDIESEASISQFISWISSASMGENWTIPEVAFGYEIEHRCSYNEDCPIEYFKTHVGQFFPESSDRFRRIIELAENGE